MFSNMTRKEYCASQASHQEGLLDVLAHSDVSILWRENDGGCKGACDRVPHQDVTQLNLSEQCPGGVCLDQALLHRLGNYIDGLNNDGIIVLHQMVRTEPTDAYPFYDVDVRSLPAKFCHRP